MNIVVSFFFVALYFIVSIFQLLVLLLLTPKRVKSIYARLDAGEEEKRIQSIKPFVLKDETVLDVGAGSGRFGKAVQERLGVKVTGVDVCDYSDYSIPFFVYDGKTLPFPDKSFDVVFFAFVLHHTRNQEILLQEACRVAKRQIVIFEDTYLYGFERYFVAWNDYHTNILQGKIKVMKGYFKGDPSQMPMPFTFRSVQGWKDFFKQFPVELSLSELRKTSYKPLQKVTFCLQLKN